MTGSHLELIQPRAMYRWGFNTADGPWELRKLARKNMLAGCDVIKTCASGGGGTDKEEPDIRNMTQEELDAVVDEAHALHKHAAVHCFTTNAQRMALKAGADTIEHMVFHDDETIELIRKSGTPVTPTLAHRTDHAIQLRREHGTADFVLRKMKYLQPFCFETFQKMYKAGIKIAMGTDMGFEPDMGSNAAELEIYVKLGMKPMDAILTTTRNAAQALKQEKDLGTIEAGKLADHHRGGRRSAEEHPLPAGEKEHQGRDEGRQDLRRPPAGQEQERRQREAGGLEDHRLLVISDK